MSILLQAPSLVPDTPPAIARAPESSQAVIHTHDQTAAKIQELLAGDPSQSVCGMDRTFLAGLTSGIAIERTLKNVPKETRAGLDTFLRQL